MATLLYYHDEPEVEVSEETCICEWCKKESEVLTDTRDAFGNFHLVCNNCKGKA